MESAGYKYEDDKSVVVDGIIMTIRGIRDIILVLLSRNKRFIDF